MKVTKEQLVNDMDIYFFDCMIQYFKDIKTRDWTVLSRNFREIYNERFDDEVEEGSEIDDFISSAIAVGQQKVIEACAHMLGEKYESVSSLLSYYIEDGFYEERKPLNHKDIKSKLKEINLELDQINQQ